MDKIGDIVLIDNDDVVMFALAMAFAFSMMEYAPQFCLFFAFCSWHRNRLAFITIAVGGVTDIVDVIGCCCDLPFSISLRYRCQLLCFVEGR